jgi:signal peptidase I
LFGDESAIAHLFSKEFGYPLVKYDSSIPGHLFWLIKDNRPLQRGDIISFRFSGSKYFPQGAQFLKIIACLPGDDLQEKERCFYCNGKFIGCAKRYDRKGNPVSFFIFKGKVPDGKYFVVGIHPDSYDSRYWGFVDKEQIIGRVKKIF